MSAETGEEKALKPPDKTVHITSPITPAKCFMDVDKGDYNSLITLCIQWKIARDRKEI